MAPGPVFRRLRQEDYNFKANIGILAITHFKTQKEDWNLVQELRAC